MAKVFRLFSDKDLSHWEDRGNDYNPTVIEKIPNPDGDSKLDKTGNSRPKEPTSIPSPFARMDLVRTAFKYVVDKYLEAEVKSKGSGTLDGDTIYHKIVSDSFDVALMFFNIDLLGARAQIRSWDKSSDLQTLLKSKNEKHKLYGETLNLFLNQDQQTYNFDLVKRIFFITYDYQIIGGTSPSTVFFTCGNDLSKVGIPPIGNDTFFDNDLRPLYKREPEFQQYLHHFFKAYPDATGRMEEFSDYLENNLKVLKAHNNELYNTIKSFDDQNTKSLEQQLKSNYELFSDKVEDAVEVLGVKLMKKKSKFRRNIIETNSEFLIKSDKYKTQLEDVNKGVEDEKVKRRIPLVLQSSFSDKLIYTDSSVRWEPATQVPFFVQETDIDERILPGQLDKYPFLTVSDFLQSHLIRLVYPINKSKYFDGNIKFETGDRGKNFLLPLTNKFFDFFDTSDLKTLLPDGKQMFEMIVYAGSVDVILRIPIKADSQYITLKRTYTNKGVGNSKEPDIQNNKGYIIENQFGLTLYPFVKTGNDNNSFYRVMLVDRDITDDTRHYNYDLSFYKNQNNELVNYGSKKTRSTKEQDNVTSNFFVVEKEFDYIEVKHNDALGIVIPLFPKVKSGVEEFTFAIDFGTTNTHIEYTLDYTRKKNPRERIIKPFEITANDMQIATLHDPSSEESSIAVSGAFQIFDLIPHEFLPGEIGKEFEFRFPQRTIVGHHESVDTSVPTFSLADFNIPFIYEKEPSYRGTKIKTNLKWSNYTLNENDAIKVDAIKVEAFFDELMFLIRNKVLLNNGKLDSTNLIWFYPSSMIEDRRNKLETTWQTLFKKYITTQRVPKMLSESIAPFYFFKYKGGIDASDLPVAAIDIGGGTSDIVIYKDNKPEILTSFRFAANSIFGDAFNGSPELNGFVIKYLHKIREQLENNELQDLVSVLDDINSEQSSEDIAAFFFSIENNKLIQENQIPISFKKMLSNDSDLKIVFIVFYSAIIYHLAKLMKVKGLDAPRFLTFSGTGSKVIAIADSNAGLLGLQKLTNLIFKKIYSNTETNIEIKQHQEPKEITCRGGLLSDADLDIEDIKTVLIGDKDNTVIPGSSLNYSQINDEKILKGIVDEVKSFIDLLFDLNNEFNFSNKFGVNPANLSDYQNVLKEDLMRYLKSGLETKKQDLSGKTNINIEEPLFFYPLVGALNNLAYKIVTQLKS